MSLKVSVVSVVVYAAALDSPFGTEAAQPIWAVGGGVACQCCRC